MSWAYGSLCVYRLKSSTAYEQVMAFSVGGFFVSALALMFGGALINVPVTSTQIFSATPLLVITSVMIIPMLFLTIWPAKLLSPGRVGLLLMSEVIVGIGSAALLLDEPFGMREIIGTCLVIAAGLVEVFGSSQTPSPQDT